jgi:hypothetical protein
VSKPYVALLVVAVLGVASIASAASSAVVPVPEPATGLLIATGVGAGIAALRRRGK